jgi:hypothetical protein
VHHRARLHADGAIIEKVAIDHPAPGLGEGYREVVHQAVEVVGRAYDPPMNDSLKIRATIFAASE